MLSARMFLALLFLPLIGIIPVSGQEMLGTTLGNYSGVNGAQLNPSALHNAKTYLDVQFLGADAFIQNYFLFIDKKDYRFSNFFKAGYEWPTHPEDYGTEERMFYYYKNSRPKNIFINLRINGPGAMLIWKRHAFAIHTGVRSVLSFHNLPYDLANFTYLGLNYRPQQNINYIDNKPFRISGMAWGEIGISYACNVYQRGFDKLSAGISVKRLFGITGMYLNSRQLDYIVIDDSTVNVRNLDAEIGMALPVSYESNSLNMDNLFKGGGFSFDLGVTYTRLIKMHQTEYFTTFCAQPYEDYLFRIGVALIDIGAVRFKTNSRKYAIDNRGSYWENLTSYNFSNIGQLMDTISYKFYGDSSAALVGEKFTLWLPSALSIQFDYHLMRNWYVNASLIYGFNFSMNSLARPSQLSITPRYETRWFEASLPISFYDWYLTRIGLALRFYGFTIGTEKLGGFFNLNDFTGLDLYFSIKLFFNKGVCHLKGPKGCGNGEYDRKKLKF